jgi:hypothetical protein
MEARWKCLKRPFPSGAVFSPSVGGPSHPVGPPRSRYSLSIVCVKKNLTVALSPPPPSCITTNPGGALSW